MAVGAAMQLPWAGLWLLMIGGGAGPGPTGPGLLIAPALALLVGALTGLYCGDHPDRRGRAAALAGAGVACLFGAVIGGLAGLVLALTVGRHDGMAFLSAPFAAIVAGVGSMPGGAGAGWWLDREAPVEPS
jgi:hypothetical protein